MGTARSPLWDLVEGTSQGNEAPVSTSLASANGSGDAGGGEGSLRSDTTLWNGAAEDVGSLRGNVKKATGELTDSQKGLGSGDVTVTGLETGAAQLTVYDTWERYLDLLSRETAELDDKLRKAGSDHYKNEEAIEAAFSQQLTKPEQ
ncbi:hypothetical protein JJV70_22085 [Streptomyces sp. JJ66]|uniref:hypothetical protein n=1 Tax=Streptomyces sp. JJ66 TaxID=2803843 RepID=UPI001C59EDB9|nr:hypothetical protein [Streptomyces sp. JJ66]MBW1604735.1 hypothetical protein [Streptomyces sp. JJ66]